MKNIFLDTNIIVDVILERERVGKPLLSGFRVHPEQEAYTKQQHD